MLLNSEVKNCCAVLWCGIGVVPGSLFGSWSIKTVMFWIYLSRKVCLMLPLKFQFYSIVRSRKDIFCSNPSYLIWQPTWITFTLCQLQAICKNFPQTQAILLAEETDHFCYRLLKDFYTDHYVIFMTFLIPFQEHILIFDYYLCELQVCCVTNAGCIISAPLD